MEGDVPEVGVAEVPVPEAMKGKDTIIDLNASDSEGDKEKKRSEVAASDALYHNIYEALAVLQEMESFRERYDISWGYEGCYVNLFKKLERLVVGKAFRKVEKRKLLEGYADESYRLWGELHDI